MGFPTFAMARLTFLCIGLIALALPIEVSGQTAFGPLEIGALDYQPASDSFVALTRSSASNFELRAITTEGVSFRFGSGSWAESAPIAVVQDGNDFEDGHVFTARDTPGRITQLSASGGVVSESWVTLPGETGIVTALAFSHGGPFGNDLMVGTAAGNLWRIDGNGRSSFLGAVGYPIRAVLPLPSDPKFGALSGSLLVATGRPKCQLLGVDLRGTAQPIDGPGCITDLDMVVPGADLYVAGSAPVDSKLIPGVFQFAALNFEGFACDVLMGRDNGAVQVLNSTFASASDVRGAESIRAQHAAFAGSAMQCQPEVCGDEIDNNGNGDADEGCSPPCEGDDCQEDAEPVVPWDVVASRRSYTGCPAERWASMPNAWAGLDPKQSLSTLFRLAANPESQEFGRLSLLSILRERQSGGGQAEVERARLSIAGIAAALNTFDDDTGYPMTREFVSDQVNTALASDYAPRMHALAVVLEAYNNRECRLPQPPKGG